MPHDESDRVVVEREFSHPTEKVWRALSQPHLIEEWLMKNDFVPVIGHRFNLRGDWGGVLNCEVLAIEDGRSLSYTWDHPNDDPAFNLKSVVTFTLIAIQGGTRLRVEQVGFGPLQKRAHAGARMGWQNFLGKLVELLDKTETDQLKEAL